MTTPNTAALPPQDTPQGDWTGANTGVGGNANNNSYQAPTPNPNPNNTNARPYPPQNAQRLPQRALYKSQMKNGFLTFVFACIPGAGQMYQGLFKRGISLMSAFFLLLGFSSWAFIPPLTFLLPVVWFYAFFDAINRMRMSVSELALVKDEFLFSSSSEQNAQFSKIISKWHKPIGWWLVGIGVYTIFDMLFAQIFKYLGSTLIRDILWSVQRSLPALAVAGVCVAIGVCLVKDSVRKVIKDNNNEESAKL